MKEILLFSTPYCGQCRTVKDVLTRRGIDYTAIDCTDENNKDAVEAYGIQHVPVMVVKHDDNGYQTILENMGDILRYINEISKK